MGRPVKDPYQASLLGWGAWVSVPGQPLLQTLGASSSALPGHLSSGAQPVCVSGRAL